MVKTDSVEVVEFARQYLPDFKSLNYQWIDKYFKREKKDVEMVENAEREIIAPGGQIFFALLDSQVVGTGAAVKLSATEYEIAKMGVREEIRGQGIGKKILLAAEQWIRRQGGQRIVLLTNSILKPATTLYRHCGYKIIHEGSHPDYERCNLIFEKHI